MSLNESGEDTLSNLDTILLSEDFTDITPGSFRYIDLRFGNKVFVNRTEEVVTTSTVTGIDTFTLEVSTDNLSVEEEQDFVAPTDENATTTNDVVESAATTSTEVED